VDREWGGKRNFGVGTLGLSMAGGLGEQGPWIPVELWGLAVELAERCRVSRNLRTLRVGFYSLQERVAACGPASEETGMALAWAVIFRSLWLLSQG
jgi:hypothetical protein